MDEERDFWMIIWRALLMITNALDKRWQFSAKSHRRSELR